MIAVGHTATCVCARQSRERAQAAYDKRWPKRCSHCLTWTNSEWPCQYCLSYFFTCPRCGVREAMDPEDGLIPCRFCGFDENDNNTKGNKRPAEFECRCRVAKVQALKDQERKFSIERDRYDRALEDVHSELRRYQ